MQNRKTKTCTCFVLSLCIFPSPFYSNGVSGDDDEWDYSDRMVDPNKPGVPVRALYDYEGVESDELSFKVGELAVGSSNTMGLVPGGGHLGDVFAGPSLIFGPVTNRTYPLFAPFHSLPFPQCGIACVFLWQDLKGTKYLILVMGFETVDTIFKY